MGNLPRDASAVAAISPSVAAGTSMPPTSGPMTGMKEITSTTAMYMKNRPASASGWRRKVRMPSLTHSMPVRGATTFSFMAAGGSRGHRVRDALAQHALEMGGVVRLQQRGFARQVEVPQARDPE